MMMMPADNAAATEYTDTERLPWVELNRPWGLTKMKLLSVSRISNTFVNIVSYRKGMQLPTHHHSGSVHAYTFEGSWHYKEYDWVARAGSYVYEAPGTNHTLEVLEDTLAMFVTQGAFIYFDKEGRISSFSDALTMLDDCRKALAVQGIPFPEEIVRD
jgi:quercetin dioxygenase-like cupin family protein